MNKMKEQKMNKQDARKLLDQFRNCHFEKCPYGDLCFETCKYYYDSTKLNEALKVAVEELSD